MRKKEEARNTLYSALDETNNGRYPALYISVFSFNPNDIKIIEYCHGKRDYKWLNRFMSVGISRGERDYRFLMADQTELFPPKRNTLPNIAPCLIIPYLLDNPCKELKIMLDGEINLLEEQVLRQNLKKFFPGKIHIENFVKNSHELLQRQPILLRAADEQIHFLFRRKLQELSDEKYAKRRVKILQEIIVR